MQEDVGQDNDLHSTVANRIVELAKHDQKKITARQSGVAVIAVRCFHWRTCLTNTYPHEHDRRFNAELAIMFVQHMRSYKRLFIIVVIGDLIARGYMGCRCALPQG